MAAPAAFVDRLSQDSWGRFDEEERMSMAVIGNIVAEAVAEEIQVALGGLRGDLKAPSESPCS